MAKKVQPEQKPDYVKLRHTAYEYVVEQGKTQKEVAVLLGVTEKTMSDWAKEGNWREQRKLRQSSASTARENIQRIISLLSQKRLNLEYQINDAKDAGDTDLEIRLRKEANSISADIRWNSKNIEGMDKDNITLGVYVDVFDDIFSALRVYNPDLFEETIEFQTVHLRRKSNELG
ncbi:MAG: hypothetical protein E6767_18875 [Dysgonomonas sp.]|nr:hypothetical protein [Dysgonomonas sp.]